MALNIIHEKKTYSDKKHEFEHHRNPSGINNKVSWLLEQSKRDEVELLKLFNCIIMGKYQTLISWHTAFIKALQVIRYDFKDVHQLNKFLDPQQDKTNYLLKLLNENIDLHNRNVAYRVILEKYGNLEEADNYHEETMKAIINEQYNNYTKGDLNVDK